jgi:hypothetical protein
MPRVSCCSPDLSEVHRSHQKVRRESKIWWRLRHPNILPCLGSIINLPGVKQFGAIVSPVSNLTLVDRQCSHRRIRKWCENGTADIYLSKNSSLSKRVRLVCPSPLSLPCPLNHLSFAMWLKLFTISTIVILQSFMET